MINKFRVDYHMHTTNSLDGKNTAEEMCLSAIEKGLVEIAITDHFEIYPFLIEGRKCSYNNQPVETLAEIRSLQKKYSHKLTIRRGVELGQSYHNLFLADEIIRKGKYDFIIGSVHIFDNQYMEDIDYTQSPIKDIAFKYFKEVLTLVGNSDFDSVGHLNIFSRYAAKMSVTLEDYSPFYSILTDIFTLVISKGKAIELNTSGWRQGIGHPFPNEEILKIYYECGGRMVTVGSDSHNKDDIAADFDIAYDLLKKIGFEYITTFDKRKPIFVPINI
ncbi:histidinol-phosphatase HisJ family protein [Anaerocolumna sp. MB42-C2]|uniref:histidinol-phosphatase HisJ family protein n=1 Tax=Anaerocolumna sp. MB42-C2 TaxID=3070997 RepID=UPI0027E03528|nr:histidinol-phosphatase HisJ family protein [Anaerocolumna sp. MB42-C2]WMJ89139.1 histidinol-phosphatase HisJ family protein [Anaerocolumna sp. MB42-C2]